MNIFEQIFAIQNGTPKSSRMEGWMEERWIHRENGVVYFLSGKKNKQIKGKERKHFQPARNVSVENGNFSSGTKEKRNFDGIIHIYF